MLLASLLACAKPIEAPADLDGLLHWFFTHWEDATDEELRAAATNLAPLVPTASRGTVSPMTEAEQATVALDGEQDIAQATGIFVVGPVACSFADFERVRYAIDQEGLYEAVTGDEEYIAYDREYHSDVDAYEARSVPSLTWHTLYSIKPVTTEYTADVEGGIRFVSAEGDSGPVAIERAYLPSPATFAAETSDYFEQDYQVDVLLPAGDGSVHAYGVWRDLSSLGLTDESDGVQNLILDGLEQYDRDTELVCAAGGF